MKQLQAYIEQHGNQLALGKHSYTVIRLDDSLPSKAALVRRGTEAMFAQPVRLAGHPEREGWEIVKPSGKRMRRQAAFYLEGGVVTVL